MINSTIPALAALAIFVALALAELRWPARPGRTLDGRLSTNFGLGVINMVIVAALPISTVLLAGASAYPGVLAYVVLPAVAVAALGIAWRTLVQYVGHRLLHGIPLLWRVHRVHHTDRQVDLSTFLRNHPFELLVMFPIALPTQIALGLPAWSVLLAEGTLFASNMISHANIRLAYDQELAWVFTTPGFHLSHHSADRFEHDSNYGQLLTLWDRLFGTYRYVECNGALGLSNASRPAEEQLFRELLSPFKEISARER